jgi:hypothetical protein
MIAKRLLKSTLNAAGTTFLVLGATHVLVLAGTPAVIVPIAILVVGGILYYWDLRETKAMSMRMNAKGDDIEDIDSDFAGHMHRWDLVNSHWAVGNAFVSSLSLLTLAVPHHMALAEGLANNGQTGLADVARQLYLVEGAEVVLAFAEGGHAICHSAPATN